ncbi:uncharacterized protein LAESUDRAFT_747283 [Laetiporus sulphureus 93-53]|uniref:DUF6593 domain-containing protein n=1 Tax=Laetiporus sulphureus 93-53 TaxID=1314785 RepID=A0A165HEN1_9APHY|nr:uncharacterized protein LAESUDRAFT_747283 [Laetiporus sulphureus 93-53]KZT11637.1 hypothetical protein LAESUDRAFT_747283 [Laetiporus sulphureus 93-53]
MPVAGRVCVWWVEQCVYIRQPAETGTLSVGTLIYSTSVPMATNEPSHLFFTAKDDPREDCIIIGFTYGSTTASGQDKPIFFRFTTAEISPGETRTTVIRDEGQVVAHLDWEADVHLGMATIGNKHQPMSYMVIRNPASNGRIFEVNGRQYEWREVLGQIDCYDLFRTSPMPHAQIAIFRRETRDTPVGPAHAVMQYIFDDDVLLLEALVDGIASASRVSLMLFAFSQRGRYIASMGYCVMQHV